MSSDLFSKTIIFVDDAFNGNVKHFEQTVYWAKHLHPKVDEAMLIAAYSHDIQRAFGEHIELKSLSKSKSGFKDANLMKTHQEKGAEIMGEYLKKQGADKVLIEKVMHLISKHEVGGDEEQNVLKDADSLSFFECNVDHFVNNKAPDVGKKKVKEKFNWMYDRISSEKARKIAKPMYKAALKSLEEK